jgi:hypothetical protein
LDCRANCRPRWCSIRASCRRRQSARSRSDPYFPGGGGILSATGGRNLSV